MRGCAIFFLAIFTSLAFGQAKPRQATLTQQKVCADEARKAFKEYYVPDKNGGLTYEYTSHYDPAANICYIMVHGTGVYKDTGTPASSDVVFDAIEGRTYASYSWINTEKKKFWEVAPMECNVKPRGGEPITCKSSDEFEQLVDKYFGIGR
jgi:hypothetical protein